MECHFLDIFFDENISNPKYLSISWRSSVRNFNSACQVNHVFYLQTLIKSTNVDANMSQNIALPQNITCIINFRLQTDNLATQNVDSSLFITRKMYKLDYSFNQQFSLFSKLKHFKYCKYKSIRNE